MVGDKPGGERESKPRIESIPSDPQEIARREAANALRQFDAVVKLVDEALQTGSGFRLRPSTTLDLNRIAIEGTDQYPGVFRPCPVSIEGSSHQPPEAKDVPKLVEEIDCDGLLIDTFLKDIGKGLLDYYHLEQLEKFVDDIHAVGKEAWLAGSISQPELPALWRTGVDVVCIRGAACISGEGPGRFGALEDRIVSELVATIGE